MTRNSRQEKVESSEELNIGTFDSLLECLLLLAVHYEKPNSRAMLLSGLPLENQRLTPSLFLRAAKRIGLSGKIVRQPLHKIQTELLPVVLILNNDEACILHEWSDGGKTAHVIYPESGQSSVTLPIEALEAKASRFVIFVRPEFCFDQRTRFDIKNHKNSWFWPTVWKNVPLYRDVLIAAFFINALALAMPLFTMNVYDRVVPNQAIETLWMLAAGVGIVVVAEFLLRTLRSYFLDLAGKRIDVQLSSDIMTRVLGMRLEGRPVSTGSFASSLRGFETLRDFVASASITAIIDLPFTLIFLCVLYWIAPALILPVLIGIVVVVGYSSILQRRMAQLTETTYRASALRNATLIESLVGLDTIKSLSAEGLMQARWERSAAFLARVSVQLRVLASSNTHMVSAIQQGVTVSVVVLGVYTMTEGNITMGGLIAASMLSSRALTPLATVAGLMTQIHHTKTAKVALDEVMDKPVEQDPDNRPLALGELKGKIEFRNVSFHYPEAEISALTEVSFTINPGERVAFLGRVGSGKSSIQKLVMGLFQPIHGKILIDGIDMRQLNVSELRSFMGYVPQDVNLFFGSLRENIVFSRPDAEDADVLRAADFANLTEFVNGHPKGFDMPVGERGESLSGGQRKSVALARAVIHQPAVLLMDEPTGSMDHATESWVNDQLQDYSKGRTLLVVTHRTSLLKMVDRIIVIDKGQIVADGPRDNVVEALKEGRIGGIH